MLNWLATTVECVAISLASTCFRPGGGSSNDWTKCPNTIESNGMVMMIPGQDHLPAQNGRKQKSLPLTSMFAFKKQSGMNFSGWSQYFGLFAIHHTFTRMCTQLEGHLQQDWRHGGSCGG
jgi:hypothetical protein